jgi:perosamine synthetase
VIPYNRAVFGIEEARAVVEVLSAGLAAGGAEAEALERDVARYLGIEPDRVVAAASGTEALHLALVGAGIHDDAEVIVPSLDGVVAANTVAAVGGCPVFAEVDPRRRTLTAATVAPLITPRTTAVVVVHHAGTPADVDELRHLCDPLGIEVVEDAAPALGATIDGSPVGVGPGFVAFSLSGGNVITCGEGGLLCVPDVDVADRLRRIRSHGASAVDLALPGAELARTIHREVGWNARLSDVHAAIARVQLRRLPLLLHRRRHLAGRYECLLQGAGLVTIADPPRATSTFQSFWVELPEGGPTARDLVRSLLANGINARRSAVAAHLEPAYAGRVQAPLRTTERMVTSTVSLPLFHDLEEADVERVVDVVLDAVRPLVEAR